MLTPADIAAIEHLVGVYLVAKDALAAATWSRICQMAKAKGVEVVGRAAAVSVARSTGITVALTAAEVQFLRNVALKEAAKQAAKQGAKAGLTVSMETFVTQLGVNFGRCPKGPGPLMIMAFFVSLAMTTQSVHAATMDVENYQKYLLRHADFVARRIAQGDLGRGGHIERPLLFEEWQNAQHIAI
jgi:hypothetical protein